eukprot:scaffold746_cov508-Prasinococcus_capsulatus_cf.AAC.1
MLYCGGIFSSLSLYPVALRVDSYTLNMNRRGAGTLVGEEGHGLLGNAFRDQIAIDWNWLSSPIDVFNPPVEAGTANSGN